MKNLKNSLDDLIKIEIDKYIQNDNDIEFIVTDKLYDALVEILKYLTDDLIIDKENISIRYYHKNAIVLYLEFGYEKANFDLVDNEFSISSRLRRNYNRGVVKIDHSDVGNDRYNTLKHHIKNELIKIHELVNVENYLNYLFQNVEELNMIKKLLEENTLMDKNQNQVNVLKRIRLILNH